MYGVRLSLVLMKIYKFPKVQYMFCLPHPLYFRLHYVNFGLLTHRLPHSALSPSLSYDILPRFAASVLQSSIRHEAIPRGNYTNVQSVHSQ